MMWRTHLLGGVASVWPLAFVPDTNLAVLSAIAGLGALLPDLDANESHLKRLKVGHRAFQPFALPATLFARLLGHRGLLHSVLGLATIALVLGLPLALLFNWTYAVALLLGYASHILLDACTRSGVLLWYPKRERLHLLPARLRVTTNTATEDIVFGLLISPVFLLLLYALSVDTSKAALP